MLTPVFGLVKWTFIDIHVCWGFQWSTDIFFVYRENILKFMVNFTSNLNVFSLSYVVMIQVSCSVIYHSSLMLTKIYGIILLWQMSRPFKHLSVFLTQAIQVHLWFDKNYYPQELKFNKNICTCFNYFSKDLKMLLIYS